MARVERRTGSWVVVADCDDERALLAHGGRHDGRLVLEEAYYPVQEESLILPEQAPRPVAERVAIALGAAATCHRQAEFRRRRFRAI